MKNLKMYIDGKFVESKSFSFIRYTFIIFSLLIASSVRAQNSPANIVISKIEGAWFATGLYSINIANNGATYSKVGAMGGYLGNWGGYLKVAWDLVGNKTPNIVGGFTKRLTTFRTTANNPHSALYMYFGVGCGNVEHAYFDYKHVDVPIPDGSEGIWYPLPKQEISSWDAGTQVMFDTGLIYRFKHLNFNIGYSITPEISFYGGGNAPNHSIQFGVGYTF